MSDSKRMLEHLGEQFRKARPVLFIGAGFSAEAKNISRENVPTGSVLRDKLWKLCFGDEPFDGSSSLQDLFQTANTRRSRDLCDLLRACFTVDAASIPDWYQTIFSFPWFRCYTLNIDDLATAVQRRFVLPRRLATHSATTADFGRTSCSDPTQLEVIHLNGTLADLPDHVTFSLSQYADRVGADQPWFLQLSSDLMSRPVVFIGTQLEEPQMWKYIEKRLSKGGKSERELRPQSYLVTKALNRARKACLSTFNIELYDATAFEFTQNILKPLDGESKIGHEYIGLSVGSGRDSVRVPDVSELSVEPDRGTEFLLGAEPIWSDLQSNRAIERESDGEVWTNISSALGVTGIKGCIVITGTAGNGKSSAIKRVALRLSAAGHHVGWIDRYTEVPPYNIRDNMSQSSGPSLLMIDDADTFGSELSSLIRDVCTCDRHPLVVIAMRSSRVDKVINRAQLAEVPVSEVVVPGLADTDIDGLIDVLEREKKLGELVGKTRLQMHNLFEKKCGRQLLVAMIEVTSGFPFEQKVVSEHDDLETEAQRVYALVAVATALRFTLTKSDILLGVGEVNNKVINAIQQLERRQIIVSCCSGDSYQSRHRVIAEVVFNNLVRTGRLAEVLLGLAIAAAGQVPVGVFVATKARRMLQRVINHDFLLKTIGLDETRNFYGRLEDLLKGDFNYWLHRGCAEVENNNVPHAELYLNYAKALNPSDLNTQTEWAHLLFRKALSNVGGVDSQRFVEEAERCLMGNIASRGDKDAHSYHVLGVNMFQWIKRGIAALEQRRIATKKLLGVVQQGVQNHPANEPLRDLIKVISEYYVSLVVVPGK